MTTYAECKERENRARQEKMRLVFKEIIEYDPTNPELYLYTAKHNMPVPRTDIKKPEIKSGEMYWSYDLLANSGFLRAVADKDGNVLAYMRGLPIYGKNLIPGTTRLGTWYVFEEYNGNLLTDFQIEVWPSILDAHSSVWVYDSDKRCYTLTMPPVLHNVGEIHWFRVDDNRIESDVGASFVRYDYKVKTNTPNERVVRGVRAALYHQGFLTGPVPPRCNSFFPWINDYGK